MVIRIRRPWIPLVAIGMFAVMLVGVQCFKYDKTCVEPTTMSEVQSIRDNALVWTYLSKIQERSVNFYTVYYTVKPSVVSYETTIKKVYEKDGLIYIIFTSLPYIGPHDTIGEDEITFSVKYTGEIEMQDFKHLKAIPFQTTSKILKKDHNQQRRSKAGAARCGLAPAV